MMVKKRPSTLGRQVVKLTDTHWIATSPGKWPLGAKGADVAARGRATLPWRNWQTRMA